MNELTISCEPIAWTLCVLLSREPALTFLQPSRE